MRTKVLNHFHTFHPDAQDEFNRLTVEEKRLTLAIARKAEGDDLPAPKRRASQKLPKPLEDELAAVRARMDECRKVIASGVVRLVVRGLPRGEFRRLVVKHPPLETDADPEMSKAVGYGDSFIDALIVACTVKTLAHELSGGEEVPNEWLEKWGPETTDGLAGEIFEECIKLNREGQPHFPR